MPDSSRIKAQRFTDCRLIERDRFGPVSPRWHNLPEGWTPTAWMIVTAGPDASA